MQFKTPNVSIIQTKVKVKRARAVANKQAFVVGGIAGLASAAFGPTPKAAAVLGLGVGAASAVATKIVASSRAAAGKGILSKKRTNEARMTRNSSAYISNSQADDIMPYYQ